MDKGYYEFLVKGKPNTMAKILKVVLFILTVLTLIGALLLGNMVVMVLGVAFGVGTYFASLFTDVEYEYLYLEKELSIDKVFNKERRKHAETLSLDKAQVFAPEKSSKLDNFGKMNGKVTDYSCAEENNGLKKYVMYYEGNRKILFSLDEEMIKILKSKCPRIFSEY
jgi:hypothetical protein